MTERIETARGDWDEDGFHLTIVSDEGEREYLVVDTTAARDLLGAAAPLHAWEAEERLERNAYDNATVEERRAVLDPDGMLPTGATAEQMRERADHDRKAQRENRQ